MTSLNRIIIVCVICLSCLGRTVTGQSSYQSPLLGSWSAYVEHKKLTPFGLEWIQLGPVINSARVEAIQGDPGKPGTFYVAFGSGNLWKTVDHGLNWKPIFEDQPALGIGDIALAPSNSDILYLGTGESLKKPRNFTMSGVGVFRSDDAGDNWKYLGLPDSYHIGEIAVHPANPDIVFVAVMGHFWTPNKNRGLYRSMDGGETWELVLYVDENTGANDVVISAADPQVIYTSMWNNYPDVMGNTSGVYTSKDGGDSWDKCEDGFPSGKFTGRIGLAVSGQNPDKVYALVDNRNPKLANASEVYKSVDGGKHWIRSHTDDLKIMARLGWYFADCYVNPQDDEEFWGLGVRLAHSSDGARSFDLVQGNVFHHNPSRAVPLHLDHCEMWINPLNPNHILLGNDGGLYMSYDKGKNWRHFNNIPAGEFYDIAVDNQDPYLVYGGVQDNSSVYGPSKEWNPMYPDGWNYIWIDAWSGGDGCVTYPDPDDPNTIYTSYQNGGIFRKNMLEDQSKGIKPRLPKSIKGKLSYNFIAPYIISSHQNSRLYHAGNYVFKSENKGDKWDLISPDLSRSSNYERTSLAAGAIAESPLDENLLFVGTDHGAFWISEDQGMNWEERSDGLPIAYIRSIQPSAFDRDRIYISLTGMNYDDLSKHLYYSEDLGKTWNNIGSNLPDEVINCIVEDPNYENLLFAGGYRGAYISTNRGASWSLLGRNLAATCVSDLVIQKEAKELVMGTHGRGIYKLELEPLYYFLDQQFVEEGFLFPVSQGWEPYYNDTHRDVNPESLKKTTFTFWLAKPGKVKLTITGGLKRKFEIELQGNQGINQFRWDLVTRQTDNGSPYFIHFKQYLKAGQYKVKLEGESFVSDQRWDVEKTSFPYN
ncbi:MAG: hypothetical protein U9N86_04640 [Bacteroidota bacterium]|nr:hypothetical protein [Bacteroidota bacterium]